MGSNRLSESASFELPSLAGLIESEGAKGPTDATQGPAIPSRPSVLFPMLQVLKLHDNSIRSIQGLQLYGFTGQLLTSK